MDTQIQIVVANLHKYMFPYFAKFSFIHIFLKTYCMIRDNLKLFGILI